jgi:hypothetical protein
LDSQRPSFLAQAVMPWFVKLERGIVDKAIFDRHVPAHKAFVQSLDLFKNKENWQVNLSLAFGG